MFYLLTSNEKDKFEQDIFDSIFPKLIIHMSFNGSYVYSEEKKSKN